MKDTGTIDEKVLARRIKDGEHTAFEIIFRDYYRGLVVFASNFVQDIHAAEEIVQAFFVKLWEKRALIDDKQPLRSYLFTSIKNSSINYLMQKKVRKEALELIMQASEQHMLFNENLYMEKELQEKIIECIDALPERCREVFELSRNAGMKNEEIAVSLNLSKRTVEKHISNAIFTLRKNLTDYSCLILPFIKF